ncbi:BnaA10g08660D [Brassica napus]|uniref:BnaA10g08660D protein n=1 Tax=Brassica napus TaxID=3708 RepID=A0A078FKL3_BRANA|nr:BnaA10g08660D [Brassica napus]
MSTSLHSEWETYGLMIVMKEDELEVEQKSEGKYEVTVEAVEELIPEVEELIAEVELVEVDMKVLVVKEVVSGHGDVEGLVVVVGCVLLWLEADNHIHNQTIGA